MTTKQRVVLLGSVALNILLIIALAWGYTKINFATEQIFLNEVQHHLMELEGLIAHQKVHEWPEPNLVTTKLGDVLDGLRLGMETGNHLRSITRHEQKVLNDFYLWIHL